MNRPPAFQFYASDWLGSSHIALMSAEQERGYLRLLLHQWNSPGCCLPDDDDVLARLSLMGQGWFNGGSALVRKCFGPNPDVPGTIRNEKLYQVYLRQVSWRVKSALGGRNSAEAKKLQRSRVVQPPLQANSQPKGNTSAFSLQPSNSNTPIVPTKTKKSRGSNRDYSSDFEAFWSVYPKVGRVKKPDAWKAWQEAITRAAVGDILKGARLYAVSDTGKSQYAGYASTWLRADRWAEDPVSWQRQTQTNSGVPLLQLE